MKRHLMQSYRSADSLTTMQAQIRSTIAQAVATATALTLTTLPGPARNMPTSNAQTADNKVRTLSDEDLLNPKKLIFDRSLVLTDSFDGAPIGQVFVSKRSILGNAKVGVIGEKGSPNYQRYCLLFCPGGTTDIDASYLYVIEKKGECTIGVRGIGWTDKSEEFQGSLFSGRMVETGRVSHTSTGANINEISINNIRVSPALNQEQLTGPHGTNYKYFPRNRNFLGDQTTSNEGYITDIHYFSAGPLVAAANSGMAVVVSMPNWRPSRHEITGAALQQLRQLTARCESDDS